MNTFHYVNLMTLFGVCVVVKIKLLRIITIIKQEITKASIVLNK